MGSVFTVNYVVINAAISISKLKDRKAPKCSSVLANIYVFKSMVCHSGLLEFGELEGFFREKTLN